MILSSDEAAIAEYMGWITEPYWWCVKCDEEKAWHHVTNDGRCTDCSCAVIVKGEYNFDLNDAGLCVSRMVEKGDWAKFLRAVFTEETNADYRFKAHSGLWIWPDDYMQWLFNPENFFSAMASWLRSKI